MGCDYYSRTIHGARTSLLIGLIVVVAAAAVGVVVGAVAGYFGGVFDALVSRAADMWMAMPIVLGGMFFLSFIEQRGMPQVILVLTLFAWPAMVRLTRSLVMQVRDSEFVLAARALGANHRRLLTRHIIPHSLRPVVVYSAPFAGTAVAAEAILSYMGVGLQLPAISWGLMLSGIQHRLPGHAHLLFPGVFLTGTVLGLILLADALRNATEPEVR